MFATRISGTLKKQVTQGVPLIIVNMCERSTGLFEL